MFLSFLYRVLLLFGFSVLTLNAQELPPTNIYSSEDYRAENQNWSISQADDNTMYFANNAGLLEFDGERWELHPSPNESIMRSVKSVNKRIYCGFYMEFGYYFKNTTGYLEYVSLSQQLKNISIIEDEQFWNIFSLNEWLLFQSLNRIYLYHSKNEAFKVIDSKAEISKMYKANNSIYFQKKNQGLYKIENGKGVLVSNDSIIQENRIINVFEHQNKLLIETQNNGFYVFNDKIIKPWDNPINYKIKEFSVYNSIELKNGDIAIGTISNGILVLSKEGVIKCRMNRDNGLSNNTILSLFEDRDSNIWLGLDNGINCINMDSMFKVYNDDKGTLGVVYASALYNGNLYLGTNQGLFYKKTNSTDSFSFIKGTKGQVWSLNVFNETLFCGHHLGTFIVNHNNAKKIPGTYGTWHIKTIPSHSDQLLQGNYDGLYLLKKINGIWELDHKIEGFNISSRFFEFLDPKNIFVSHEYKGVYKISLDNTYTKATKVVKENIKRGLNSSLLKYNDTVLYTYKEGVYKYSVKEEVFILDSLLSSNFNTQSFVSGKLIQEPNTKNIWQFFRNDIRIISPGQFSSTPETTIVPLPLDLRQTVNSYENILPLGNQKYILGTSFGYIKIDLDKPFNKAYNINIKYIKVSQNRNKRNMVAIDQTQEGIFPHNKNSISFNYSIPEYYRFLNPEYQYQLKGKYNNWSDWTTSSEEVFENLPYGEYTFKVRGKVNNNRVENEVSYTFTIERPWYLTNLALGVYTLILLLITILFHIIYKQYYARQRKKIIEQKNKELKLKDLENKQQQVRFKNETLIQNIDNKNKELAISTLSLIKKNEFLSHVKKELDKVKDKNAVTPIIKIINKNLNDTDDWKFFEEAFNNADKDFLKKLKSTHPDLTPNDLRLCAYLRLNLSSKEIAPLLNISPKSVEVKRYRLRKKLNLSHHSNLTNYILGF